MQALAVNNAEMSAHLKVLKSQVTNYEQQIEQLTAALSDAEKASEIAKNSEETVKNLTASLNTAEEQNKIMKSQISCQEQTIQHLTEALSGAERLSEKWKLKMQKAEMEKEIS